MSREKVHVNIPWQNKRSLTRGGDAVEQPRHFSECPGGDNWILSNFISHVAMSLQPMQLYGVAVGLRREAREWGPVLTKMPTSATFSGAKRTIYGRM